MTRVNVVTGSASGIGKVTAELLRGRGERVIGVDLRDAEVTADLSTAEGRSAMVAEVTRVSGGRIDTIVANAGLANSTPTVVAVNYFGTLATLEGLRPLLAGSPAPRAVAVSSMAALMQVDDGLVDLMAAGDEPAALARAADLIAAAPPGGDPVYSSTKRALSRWIRRTAATADWAGASIPLNAIAPGVVYTPMVAPLVATEQGRNMLEKVVPMPLNGFAEPIVMARALAWLVSEENSHLCGQIVYVDGGSDVVLRGDSVW